MPKDIHKYIKLNIYKDYTLNIEEDNIFNKYDNQVCYEKYNIKYYKKLSYDINKELADAFKKDTKINFIDFLIVLYFMANRLHHRYCIGNVIKIDIKELKTILSSIKNNHNKLVNDINFKNLLKLQVKKINKNNIYNIIELILKLSNKSIISKIGNYLIFSKTTVMYFYKSWNNLLIHLNTELLYNNNNNFNNIKELIKKVIENNQKDFENDVAKEMIPYFNIVKNHIVFAQKERKDLKEYQILGDLDVVGIDQNTNEIWLIECKYILPDYSGQKFILRYKDFFGREKYDKKFDRRINYISSNLEDFLYTYIEEKIANISNYTIKKFMVINRQFCNKFHNVNFEILSFDMFKNKLKSINKNYYK